MTAMTGTLHDSAVLAIDTYDIDALNWSDDSVVSFDLKVLEAAQETVAGCTREERIRLKISTKRSAIVHADVAMRLYELKATAADLGLVAALIMEMHSTVAQ
jgi:hypothetical protein